MGKYGSFLQYFENNYYDIVEEDLIIFLSDISGQYKYNDSFIEYNRVLIKTIKFNIIQFTKSNMDKVEFKVYFDAKFDLINTNNYPNINYECENSFIVEMTGSFARGFIVKPDTEVEISSEKTDKFTVDLVPVIPNDELDKYATQFLKYFCKEALINPMPLNIDEMFMLKGLKYYYAPLEQNVLGKTYFAEDTVTIYKNHLKSNETEEIIAKPGTILVNYYKAIDRGVGSARNTLIHEAVHWFFHRNYFELQQLLDSEQTNLVCYKAENLYANSDIYWMESQARRLAPRILMPKNTAEQKIQELIHELDTEQQIYKFNQLYYWEELVKRFAKFFKVSLTSAKIRIKELGYQRVDGVLNYSNGSKLQSFNVKPGVLSKYESFIIDDDALEVLRLKHELLHIGLSQNKLLYINNMIVANNPRYVTPNNNLTSYAAMNPEECCLIFIRIPTQSTEKDADGIVRYLASSSSNADKVNLVSMEAISKLIGLADTNFKHFNAHKKLIPDDIAGTLRYHYGKCKENKLYNSIVTLSEECDVSDLTLRNYMSGKTIPDRLRIIKIALAMKLSTPYITDMLNKIDCRKINVTKENIIFDKIVSLTDLRLDLVAVYEALKENNQEDYLEMSIKWLNFHGYI